jgi:hypothetical protein
VIDGDLQEAKMNGFARSETDAGRFVAVGNEGQFW